MSTVVRLTIRDKPAVGVTDEVIFFQIVRVAFAQRRKTLANNLKSLLGDSSGNVLEKIGIAPQRRAETLSLAEFAAISNYWATHRKVRMI